MFTMSEIKEKAIPIAKKYGVKSLSLFGSYAKGKQNNNSDVDFLVEKGNMQTLFQYIAFVNDLEKDFGCHVDVVSSEVEDQNFVDEIMKDRVLIYDK